MSEATGSESDLQSVLPSPWPALAALGLEDWRATLESLLAGRLADSAHGDMPRWRRAVERLPEVATDAEALRATLLELAPWRKGPFEVGGIRIDSEWRSDLKWARVEPVLEPLEGRAVLDVGCGNGFYALRLQAAGARLVVGIDPTLNYVMQFAALRHFLPAERIHVLPLRLQELPSGSRAFDTTLSMGVLYHQRSPIEHLRRLRQTLRPGGQLVLETLYLPGDDAFARTPPRRYARMRNVWLLPSVPELETWLARTGFRDIRVADRSVTTVDEQRTTEWMPFESLADALDPADASRSIEGWPAPRRVVVVAKSP